MENKTTKQFTNLVEVTMHFSDKKVCKEYLKKMRFNDKPYCPHCGHDQKIYTMRHNYKCSACRKQFSETKGTIFENSPIPLQKWFVAIWLFTSHKKGISSIQLSKDIGVTQKTAWFMTQRIRNAMKTNSFLKPLENHVEADETYIGGKNKNRHSNKKVANAQGRSGRDKTPVIGLVERNGRVTAMKVKKTDSKTLHNFISNNVCSEAKLYTDEWRGYNGLEKKFNLERVNHGARIYVVNNAHTNTIEGFWSLLKRGIIGIYHSVSTMHLDRYIDEFEFRYNTKDMSEDGRFDNLIGLVGGKRLTYNELIYS